MPTAPNIENVKKLVALDYPEVTGFRCVEVTIPDDDKYLYALAGFISLLGQSWSYSGERNDRIYRAARWRMAYALTTWAACMNCEELQECLQPLFDALRLQVNQDAIFRQYGTEYPTGQPLPIDVITAPLAPGSNPSCDWDILWSQSEQLVDYSNVMITDALELAETATNKFELAGVIAQLPVLDELGADAVAGYVELLIDGVAENYAAAFTLSYRNDLACEVFCVCRMDCEITIERVYEILYARVVAHFGSPGEVLNTIGNLLSYLLDQSIDGTVIADVMMFLLWGGAKLINSFIMNVGTKALETILEVAVNDANNDWETLCAVCPELAVNVGLFVECGSGIIDQVEFVDGVEFEMASYRVNFPGDGDNFAIALKLPAGNWNVEVTGVTGNTPLPDGNSAWGYFDTSNVFHNDLYPAASPATFGDQDTTFDTFDAWCDVAEFNVVLFSETPFTATFIATLLP